MKGYVSDFVLNEVFHKMMVAEVTKKFKMSAREAISYIRVNPEVISKLGAGVLGGYPLYSITYKGLKMLT